MINMPKMSKTEVDHMMMKLYHRRNINFRAFLINIVWITAAWLLTLTGFYDWIMGMFVAWDAKMLETYMYVMIGIAKIAGVVFFLVPGLAIWWEMSCLKKYTGNK
ncbi:MAG: hypothetical protein FWD33_02345 [Alphaproteobacteria bacterium]|nr:hypothetical protein [Alphaproteobacteria bacterium]